MQQVNKPRRSARQRGAILIITVASLVVIFVFASWAVDRDYLNYRRVLAQDAADTSALGGGWILAQAQGNPSAAEITAANTMSTNLAADNGYNASKDPNATVSVTYPYNGNGALYQVKVQRVEPVFFGAIYGHPTATVSATATVTFTGDQPFQTPNSGFGRINGVFNYAAYGPDNGADRGDNVDTRYYSITSGDTRDMVPNPLFGTNSGSKNFGPTDYPYGSVYEITVPKSYSTSAGTGQSMIDFEIYDPDTYDNKVDAHGTYDEMNKAPGGGASPTEDWLYTLWKGGVPGSTNATIVAQAHYGEDVPTDQADTNDHWVTPPGFSFDASSDLSASSTGVNYYVTVQTSDGSNSVGDPAHYGHGYDENGYLLRAGPPHTSYNTLSVNQPSSQAITSDALGTSNSKLTSNRADLMDPYATDPTSKLTYDQLWSNDFGPLATNGHPSGVSMEVLTDASVNDNGSGNGNAIDIYFGNAPGGNDPKAPNHYAATSITFNGWDEDSGASAITYTCDASALAGQVFTGKIGGNEAWSTDTFSFPAGTYPTSGGNWTAHYVTGTSDNTSWKWSDTSVAPTQPTVKLTYTTSNVF
jgi:hypothetical protein